MAYAIDIVALEVLMEIVDGALVDAHLISTVSEHRNEVGDVGLYASDRHPIAVRL
mgnify:CR=1 FL=1